MEQLGVKDIFAKANDTQHGRIAERVGAHHAVYPEAQMGERVAHLVTGKMIDFIEFDDGFAIAKTRSPRETHGKTLAQSDVRKKYGITVVGIKRRHQDFIYAKPETEVFIPISEMTIHRHTACASMFMGQQPNSAPLDSSAQRAGLGKGLIDQTVVMHFRRQQAQQQLRYVKPANRRRGCGR